VGKAVILEHLGSGLYRVEARFDTTGLIAKRDALEAEIVRIDTEELPAITTKINAAQAKLFSLKDEMDLLIAQFGLDLIDIEVLGAKAAEAQAAQQTLEELQAEYNRTLMKIRGHRKMIDGQLEKWIEQSTFEQQWWCADYTTDLTGTVGVCETNIEAFWHFVLEPGYFTAGAYEKDVHGTNQFAIGNTPSGTFYNLAVKPALQVGRPIFVKGRLLAVDRGTNTATVQILEVPSSIQLLDVRPKNKDVGDEEDPYTFQSVPIVYMGCNAQAFRVGDEVLVEYRRPPTDPQEPPEVPRADDPTDKFRGDMRVVGFISHPRPCGSEGFLHHRYGTPMNGGSFGSDLTDLGEGPGWIQEQNTHTGWLTAGNNAALGEPEQYQVIDTVASNRNVMWILGPRGRQFNTDSVYVGGTKIWGKRYGRGRRFGADEWIFQTGVTGYAPTFRLGADTLFVGIGLQRIAEVEYVVAACISRFPQDGTGEHDGKVEFYRAAFPSVDGEYHAETNAFGWRYLGGKTYDLESVFDIGSPVFFNASGTEAVHVRVKRPATCGGTRQVRTPRGRGTFGAFDNPKYIDYDICKFTIPTNDEDLLAEVTIPSGLQDVTHKRWIVTPTEEDGDLLVDRRTETIGSYIAYADFIGDTLVYGKINVNCTRRETVNGANIGGTRWAGNRTMRSRRLIELEFPSLDEEIPGIKVPLVDCDWNVKATFNEDESVVDPDYEHGGQNILGAFEQQESLIPEDADPFLTPERFAPVCRTFMRTLAYLDIRYGAYVTREYDHKLEIRKVPLEYPLWGGSCQLLSETSKSRSSHIRTSTFVQKAYVEHAEVASWDVISVGPMAEDNLRRMSFDKYRYRWMLNTIPNDWTPVFVGWHRYEVTATVGYHDTNAVQSVWDPVAEDYWTVGDGDVYHHEGPAGWAMAMETHTHWMGNFLWSPRRFAIQNLAGQPWVNAQCDNGWYDDSTMLTYRQMPEMAWHGDYKLIDLEKESSHLVSLVSGTPAEVQEVFRNRAAFCHGFPAWFEQNDHPRCMDAGWGYTQNADEFGNPEDPDEEHIGFQFVCPDYNDDLTGYVTWLPQYHFVDGGIAVDIAGRNMFISVNMQEGPRVLNKNLNFILPLRLVNMLSGVDDPPFGVWNPDNERNEWPQLMTLIGTPNAEVEPGLPRYYWPLWPDDPNDSEF
jgi:hypothetical protein